MPDCLAGCVPSVLHSLSHHMRSLPIGAHLHVDSHELTDPTRTKTRRRVNGLCDCRGDECNEMER
eukprot:684843-Rhodomonas_salina.1